MDPVIVNISSNSGCISEKKGNGSTGYGYSSSKAALNMVTKMLSNELRDQKIIVVILTPIQEAEYTPELLRECESKIPLGRLGKPEEVAALFAFLASDDAKFLTGQHFVIDGGESAGGLASQA